MEHKKVLNYVFSSSPQVRRISKNKFEAYDSLGSLVQVKVVGTSVQLLASNRIRVFLKCCALKTGQSVDLFVEDNLMGFLDYLYGNNMHEKVMWKMKYA